MNAPIRRQSRVWHAAFSVLLRAVPRRVALLAARRTALPYTEIVIVGRRTGVARSSVVTLFELDGRWYVGNPNGDAQWARNLAAAGAAVVLRSTTRTAVAASILQDGPERDRVVRATAHQPPPANLVYRLGRRHVQAAGSYFRLDRVGQQEVA
jgi:deazaflavin-dependent oxidoreductase (nitroreductase family)